MIIQDHRLREIHDSLDLLRITARNESIALKIASIQKSIADLQNPLSYRKKPIREFNRSLSPRLKIVAKLSKKTLSSIAHEYCLSQQILSQAVAGKSKSKRAKIALEDSWKLQLLEIQNIYKQDLKSSPSANERETFYARYKKVIGAA